MSTQPRLSRIPVLLPLLLWTAVAAAFPATPELPLVIERNVGQAGPRALYLARGSRSRLYLEAGSLAFATGGESRRFRLVFDERAEAAGVVAGMPLSGRVHYLTGGGDEDWIVGVPTYATVRYPAAFPGAALEVGGTRREFRLRFRTAAGTTPEVIAFRVEGAEVAGPRDDGGWTVDGRGYRLTLSPPRASTGDGAGAEMRGSWMALGPDKLALSIPDHDPSEPVEVVSVVTVHPLTPRPLPEKPSVSVAFGEDGSVFVAGTVSEFPVEAGSAGSAASFGEAFVTKLTADGSSPLWTAYFGGEGADDVADVGLDAAGRPWVVGTTTSRSFPPRQACATAPSNAPGVYVAHLSADGSSLLSAACLGDGNAGALALGTDGRVWVAGTGVADGGRDALLAVLTPDARIESLRRFGGSEDDRASALAIAPNGDVAVVGTTSSPDFPLVNPVRAEAAGPSEAFVVRFAPGIDTPVFATYLGGAGADSASGIVIDANGRLHVAGTTTSPGFSGPSIAVDGASTAGDRNGFVAGLTADGGLVYVRMLGGSGDDGAVALATAEGKVWVAGHSRSFDFPRSLPGRGVLRKTHTFGVVLDEDGEVSRAAFDLNGRDADLPGDVAVGSGGRYAIVGVSAEADTLHAGAIEPGGGGELFVTVGDVEPDGPACTMTFVGGSMTDPPDWNDADNWSPPGVPTSTDHACLGTNFAAVLSSGAREVATLTIVDTAALTIAGTASLDVASSSTIAGNGILLSGGTLTGSGDLVFDGPLYLNAGSLSGTGDAVINGGLTLSTSSVKWLDRHLINNSTVTWNDGTWRFAEQAVFDNQPGATFDVQGDVLLDRWAGAPQFNNMGSYVRSDGSGTHTIGSGIVFVNDGSVDILKGTLDLFGTTATHGGAFDCTGAAIDFSGLDAGASLTGSTVSFTGGSLVVLGTYDVDDTDIDSASSTVTFDAVPTLDTLTLSNGVLTGSVNIAPAGLITWNAGTIDGTGDLIVANDMHVTSTGTKWLNRHVVNTSTVTWDSGAWRFTDQAVFDNQPGATFDVQGDLFLDQWSGTPSFNNNGNYVRSAGTGVHTIDTNLDFVNTGLVEVRSGTVSLGNTYAQTAGATLLNGGDISTSTLTIDGGDLAGTGTVNGSVDMSGRSNPGFSPGSLAISGSYQQGAGGAYRVELGGAAPGSGHDVIELTGSGAATLDGSLEVSLFGGFVPTAGDSFTVMTFPSATGAFSSVTFPAGTGLDWQVTYLPNAVVLNTQAATPGTIPPTVQVDKSASTPGDLTIRWDPSCSSGGTDVRIYEGTLGSFASHSAIVCGDAGGDRTEEITPGAGNTYYLVVPVDGVNEGSYGFDSDGVDRPAGGAGLCPAIPQVLAACPS